MSFPRNPGAIEVSDALVQAVGSGICQAFCESLRATKVPVGLAVSTVFRRQDGDAIGFYIVGPDTEGRYRVEDDGLTMADLEGSGADLDTVTCAEAFRQLLDEHNARYEEAAGIIRSEPLIEPEVSHAALRFAALLLRLQDLLLLTPDRVASTFRDDAIDRKRGKP